MTRTLFFIFVLSSVYLVCAQKKDDIRRYIPTANLDMHKNANKRANRAKRKNYSIIYKASDKHTLYGNPCALVVTQKMGFEYVIQPRSQGIKSGMGKFLNNLAVKSKLVVTHTPFWRIILRSKFKKCRKLTGDLIG